MANKDITVVSSGLVSIVVPCCGMLEYTELCVPSILKHSRPPFELIFLDVGSLDGTAKYLAGLKTGLAGRVGVEIVRTQTDLGLKEACRQALRHTLGEYVVLLNNDCVVTPRWLDMLIGLVSTERVNGMAGPMSNMAAPPQLVETVPYRTFHSTSKTPSNPAGTLVDASAMERFAVSFHTENNGNWMCAERLGGFCLLIKREVLDKIGSALDEWSDLSLFDSDILSAKARETGYSLVVCRDLFVHHFGTRAFAHGPAQLATAAGVV